MDDKTHGDGGDRAGRPERTVCSGEDDDGEYDESDEDDEDIDDDDNDYHIN